MIGAGVVGVADYAASTSGCSFARWSLSRLRQKRTRRMRSLGAKLFLSLRRRASLGRASLCSYRAEAHPFDDHHRRTRIGAGAVRRTQVAVMKGVCRHNIGIMVWAGVNIVIVRRNASILECAGRTVRELAEGG